MEIDLSYQETEILAILAIISIEKRQFCTGVEMHPTLIERLESAHTKLIKALTNERI